MDTTTLTTDSEYLGITEAADYLRVSASTLRRWEKKGFLVPERTPTGIRRYTKKQLDDVIQTPAYEKPAIVPQTHPDTPVIHTPPVVETKAYEADEAPLDQYIHVVEPSTTEAMAQHTIDTELDSQADFRPSSYTSSSLNIEHNYAPLEYSRNQPQVDHHEETMETIQSDPSPVVRDNFATVEQQQFNHIFDIQDPNETEEQVELEEYDTDAAYVESEPRTSSYSYPPKEQVKQKRTQTWIKPVFLFVSLFLAIVIISLVAWFALSSSTVSGAPLNPVIE